MGKTLTTLESIGTSALNHRNKGARIEDDLGEGENPTAAEAIGPTIDTLARTGAAWAQLSMLS